MSHISTVAPSHPAPSPLVLSERLITLAQDTDRAGLRPIAVCLIELAYEVLDRTAPEFA